MSPTDELTTLRDELRALTDRTATTTCRPIT
jgi:hypothetical protein